jgi:hypothetical protein
MKANELILLHIENLNSKEYSDLKKHLEEKFGNRITECEMYFKTI